MGGRIRGAGQLASMVFRITAGEHVSDHIWLDPNAFKTPLIIGPPRESSPNMDAFYDSAQAACDWPSILPCPDLRPGPVDLSL